MAFEKTWRWFGPDDAIKLRDLKQMEIEGVVTALHHIPNGETWTTDEIIKLKNEIGSYGMRWSVVESLPVHEEIKTGGPGRSRYIANYQQSLINLARQGIDTVVYNFMPVLDWIRTSLHYTTPEGGESMLFHFPTFVAFDVFILERPDAEKDYSGETLATAERLFREMDPAQQENLARTIIVVTQGFIDGVIKGSDQNYKERFLEHIARYAHIDAGALRQNLRYFLDQVLPVAEEHKIRLAIHPDDPPFPVMGLPRIAGSQDDIREILGFSNSPCHGLTFCAGSLSARRDNNLVAMAQEFASRTHFLHLRNTRWLDDDTFYESGHLNGSVDMYELMLTFLVEQQRRKSEGRNDWRMPVRPDHGIKILSDFQLATNPGYPLAGRLKGLSELRGLELGIERNLMANSS